MEICCPTPLDSLQFQKINLKGLNSVEDSAHMVEAQIAIKGLQGHNLRVWAMLKTGDGKEDNIEGEFIKVREVFF